MTVGKQTQRGTELQKAFAELFPLCDRRDLPRATGQVKAFLKARIAHEIEQGTRHFTSRVVRILCEVSPPKTHVEDMARIVVEQAKQAEHAQVRAEELTGELHGFRTRVKELEQRVQHLQAENGRLKVFEPKEDPEHGDDDQATTEARAAQASGTKDRRSGSRADRSNAPPGAAGRPEAT